MKQIRDQVYNYIPVSSLEAEVLKRPEILRLHRVMQNSTLFATYPCNRSSRFSHSLGVMHVAGQLFKSMIHNSDSEFVFQLHKAVRVFVKKLSPQGYDDLIKSREYLIEEYKKVDGRGEFFLTQGWGVGAEIEYVNNSRDDNLLKDENYLFRYYYNTVNNILFQAVRLAALAHDIGHLPFSHVLEFSLIDLGSAKLINANNQDIVESIERLNNRYLDIIAKRTISSSATIEDARKALKHTSELHEMIGIVLIDGIPPMIRPERAIEDTFWRVCLQTAIRILTVDQLGHFESSNFRARVDEQCDRELLDWYPLGSIINGQIDCDRLDYLRRDPINSGVTELGDFDSSRIIANITPVKLDFRKDLDLNIDGEFYVPGVDRRALSAVTDYFHDRMKHYRWLVNHHNVVRTDLALTRLIIKLADIFKNREDTIIGKYLEERQFEKLWDWSNLSRDYRYVDDAWLETLLQGLYRHIISVGPTLTREEIDCRIFLEILYERKMENMIAIWKRIDGFLPFAYGFKKAFHLRNQKKPLGFITQNSELMKLDFEDEREAQTVYCTNLILSFWKKSQETTSHYSVMEMVEDKLNSDVSNPNIVFALKTVTPYKTVFVALEENKKLALDKISSVVASLNETSDKDVKLFAFDMGQHKKTSKVPWNNTAREELGTKVGNALFDVISSIDGNN